MEASKKVFVAMKRIVLTVVIRNRALDHCCPNFVGDDEQEMDNRLRELAASQRDVDDAIKALRNATEERFKDFSNEEILILTHLVNGIWSSESCLCIESKNILDIIGHNNAPEGGALVVSLLNRTSPIFRVVSMTWDGSRRGSGGYSLSIHDRRGLHNLFFGKVIAEA